MTARYRNPWHKPGKPEYGPAHYTTDAEPKPYNGHLIYQRLQQCYDIVKDGVCIGQFAGPNGARNAIDTDSPYLVKGVV
jgi:hypothetical protein